MKDAAIEGELSEAGRLSLAIYRDPNLQILFGVALMASLRDDSIAPAFPDIRQVFNLSSESVGLLITVFALPSVFLTPVLGVLADRWGRKRILVPSLLLFSLAGGACALARDYNLLLLLRLLQGVGAASLSMLNITIIADLYQGHARTTAMGYNAMMRSVGSVLFPLLGGGLAMLGWFYPFILPLLALPVLLLVAGTLQNPEPKSRRALSQYLAQGWLAFKNRQTAGLFAAGCLVFIIMFGTYFTYFPFLLKGTFQASPLVIGLLVSGRSVVNALIAGLYGRLVQIWPVSRFLQVSFVLYGLTFLFIPLAPNLWAMGGLTLLLGLAEGFFWPSNHALLGRLAPLEYRAGFMAANDMLLKLGHTIGPLLMGVAFTLGGLNTVFLVAALLAFATFGLTVMTLEPNPE